MLRGTEDGYLAEQQQLLPYGHAWSREGSGFLTRLLRGLALTWARAHNRAVNLRAEADPRATTELLPEWEDNLGLPDACSKGLGATLDERRADVLLKYLDEGRQDIQFFYELAAALGYEIIILEHRPFVCGVSRCGTERDRLNGQRDIRFLCGRSLCGTSGTQLGGGLQARYVWTVRLPGRARRLRCGQALPERLYRLDRAADLECRVRKYSQAHTLPVFSYPADSSGPVVLRFRCGTHRAAAPLYSIVMADNSVTFGGIV